MMTLKETLDMLRPNIAGLKPYSSARNEFPESDAILLDANENPYNPRYSMLAVNRYPDPFQRKAKEKIAGIKGVRPEQIFLGNGSDEAVDLIIRCFCEPSTDSIAIFAPTYGMYEVSANINNVEVIHVPLTDDFELNIDEILSHHARCLFVCSPNNPSGNRLKNVQRLLDEFEGIVVVDEAYIDFGGETAIPLVAEHPNLLVVQTMSKSRALAGLRVGYAIGDAALIQGLTRVKDSFNSYPLGRTAQAGAIASVEDDDYFQASCAAFWVVASGAARKASIALSRSFALASESEYIASARSPYVLTTSLTAGASAKAGRATVPTNASPVAQAIAIANFDIVPSPSCFWVWR